MNITLLSIGKTQSSQLQALEEEYAKRIRGRFTFTRQYVKNEKELLAALNTTSARVILLDENGSVMNSREFAQYMESATQTGKDMVFVIGDAAGFPQQIRALNADMIAISEMTFPHEVARVLLIEQLYRAQTILDGHPYHK